MRLKKLVTCFVLSAVVMCGLGISNSVYCQAEDNIFDLGTPYDYQDSEGNKYKLWITDDGILTLSGVAKQGTRLKELVIPDTVKEIYVNSLHIIKAEKTYIPKTVLKMYLGDNNDTSEFIIDEDNPNYCSVDGVAYTKDMKTMVGYPQLRKDEVYKVPETVEDLWIYWTAMHSKPLEYIIFPSSLKKIDSYKIGYLPYLDLKFYVPSDFDYMTEKDWNDYISRYNQYNEYNGSDEPKIVYTEADNPVMEIFNSDSSWLPVTGSDNYNLRHLTTALKMSLGIYDTQIDLWKYEHTGKESLLFDEDENGKVDMQDVVVVLNKVLGIK